MSEKQAVRSIQEKSTDLDNRVRYYRYLVENNDKLRAELLSKYNQAKSDLDRHDEKVVMAESIIAECIGKKDKLVHEVKVVQATPALEKLAAIRRKFLELSA